MRPRLASGLTIAAVLAACTWLVAPAHARLTPPGIAVSAISTDFELRLGGIAGVACSQARFAGKVSADGRFMRGSIDFLPGTCTDLLFGSACAISARGAITFELTGRVRITGASLSIWFHRDFEAIVTCLVFATRIAGGQRTASCALFTQRVQAMSLGCTVRGASGEVMSLTGSYELEARGASTITVS